MKKHLILGSILLLCGGAGSVVGHTIWLEPLDGRLAARFAEPGNRFEKSPGYLDSLSSPRAFVVVTNGAVLTPVSKQPDHFLLPESSTTNTACIETIFTVRGGRKPYFYARWQPIGHAGTPSLTLDLVPTGTAGVVRVHFRAKPLANVKATLRAPDEQESELTADSEGYLRFEAKSPGQYLLTVPHHREPLTGYYDGRAYSEISHNAALTWRQQGP
jgi:hypothetical protein